MSKIIVRNTKTGQERPMTQTSFDYLSAKKRGFEFVRKIEAPKSEIQKLMDQKIAEKAQKDAADAEVTEPVKKPGRPAKAKTEEA